MWYKKPPVRLREALTLAKSSQFQRGAGGAASGGRASLEPDPPLSLRIALLQVAILLGIPIAVLVFAKVILRAFFPELGY
jgi:hypothetical protein